MIGTELEKMVLDGNAVFRVASIGMAGLSAMVLPKGKSAVITDITIQPFANVITDDERFASNETFRRPTDQNLTEILKRTMFQLLMYNSRGVQNRWTFKSEYQLNSVTDPVTAAFETSPTVTFAEKKIECYVLVEELTWFYFLFPDFTGVQTILQTQPLGNYFSNVNNFPQAPFGWDPANSDVQFFAQNPGPQFYSPLGLDNSFNPPSPVPNASTTLNLLNSGPDSPLVMPGPDPAINFTSSMLPSMPIMNISYVEINKRTTTSGIV